MNVKAKSSTESNRAHLENVCIFSPSIGGFLITVAARSKVWVCVRWLARITGSNSAGGNVSLSLVSVVFGVRSGRSLVRRSPTECGVCQCELEVSTVRRPWTTGSVEP
jgi:hypothetical protein